MAQFIEGLDRQQTMLLPEHLEIMLTRTALSVPLMPLVTCLISQRLVSMCNPLLLADRGIIQV